MTNVIQDLAHVKAKQLNFQLCNGIRDTLWTIDFEVPYQNFVDQEETAKANLELDKKSCLGRVAQAAALVEKYFPEAEIQLAEVKEDRLAQMMLEILTEGPSKRYDPFFMRELLMYEEPHMVLLVDGVQFEPLSLQLGQDIQHPRVETFSLWEGVTASVLTSRAWLEQDPRAKMDTLVRAETFCSGTSLVSENICEPLELLGRHRDLKDRVSWCVKERPCARNLYVMYALTGDKSYYDHLVKVYSEEIIKYL